MFDKEERLIDLAKSFLDKDLENVPIIIQRVNDIFYSIIFNVENNNFILNGKTMIDESDIQVNIDLGNETIEINKINKNGWIKQETNGEASQNIWELRNIDYYILVKTKNESYLQCDSYMSDALYVSDDTLNNSKGHSSYNEKYMGRTLVNVSDEYSILDGYPTNQVVKSFKKYIIAE